jgi:hypothetical protein
MRPVALPVRRLCALQRRDLRCSFRGVSYEVKIWEPSKSHLFTRIVTSSLKWAAL